MEIDPHHLPAEVNLLQQIVLQLLQAVEDKDQLVGRLQHQLAQLLRYRYGQKRERIDENQLFLFAAQIIAASLQMDPDPTGEEPAVNPSLNSDRKEKTEKPERRGHGRNSLPKSLERRRVVFDLEESQRQCQHCHTPMQKIGEDVSDSFLLLCRSSKKFAPSMPVRRGVVWWRRRNRRHLSRRACRGRVCWHTWS